MNSKKDVDAATANISRRVLIGGAAAGLGLAATALDAILPKEADAQPQPAEVCSFALQIDGFFNGFFRSVSGLGSETEVIEHKSSDVIRKIPGRAKWGDIVLKRGMSTDMALVEWRKLVEDGGVREARKDGSIVAYNETLAPIAQWNFTNAWPSKLYVGSLDASEHRCPEEVVTLTVEFVNRVPPR